MNSPFPTPQQIYDLLPYQFPLVDQQPVVRIPVAGPAPFNMLAVVRTVAVVTQYSVADGLMDRQRLSLGTNLVLSGYDPLRPEQQLVRHSSSATVRMMQISAEVGALTDDNTNFTFAVDEVETESKLDETGRWYVTVDVAASVVQVYAGATMEVTSWVLCWEPR